MILIVSTIVVNTFIDDSIILNIIVEVLRGWEDHMQSLVPQEK